MPDRSRKLNSTIGDRLGGTALPLVGLCLLVGSAFGAPAPEAVWPMPPLVITGTGKITRAKDQHAKPTTVEFETIVIDGAFFSRVRAADGDYGMFHLPQESVSAFWKRGEPKLTSPEALFTISIPSALAGSLTPYAYRALYWGLISPTGTYARQIASRHQNGDTTTVTFKPVVINEGTPEQFLQERVYTITTSGEVIRRIDVDLVNTLPNGTVHIVQNMRTIAEGAVDGYPSLPRTVTRELMSLDGSQPPYVNERIVAQVGSVKPYTGPRDRQTIARKLFGDMELATPEANLTAYGITVESVAGARGGGAAHQEGVKRALWPILIGAGLLVLLAGFYQFYRRAMAAEEAR